MSAKSALISVILILALSGLVAASASVSAHLPIYESGGSTMETALHIPDPSTSYATYAEFPKGLNGIQFYSLTAKAGQGQYIELDVPSIEYSREFAPVLLLIGPGLPQPNASTEYVLDFYGTNLTSGQGALSWNYTGPLDEEEFEPFTQVLLLKRQSVNVTLPSDGTYFIAVGKWPFIPSPNDLIIVKGVAKYILVTGTLEKFALTDYILIPYDWVKGHLFWDENPLIFLLPTYLITAAALVFTTYMRRSRPTPSAVGSRRTEQAVFYAALTGGLLMVSGGINQLVFLLGNPLFSLGIGETIVLMLQGIGIVAGIVALRLSFAFLKPARLYRLIAAAAIFLVALIVGSGFLVGPILFLSAAVAGFRVFRPRI
jgi:hypothetical protein